MSSPHETVTVIVEGALEEEHIFHDYANRNQFIQDIAEEARADGAETEVYVLRHYHEPDSPCECVQFATSHKPDYTFPGDEPPEIGQR